VTKGVSKGGAGGHNWGSEEEAAKAAMAGESVPATPLSPAAREALALAPELFETALTGGDDYEILCCGGNGLALAAAGAGEPLRKIGEIVAGDGLPEFYDEKGNYLWVSRESSGISREWKSPFGKIGDRVWPGVRTAGNRRMAITTAGEKVVMNRNPVGQITKRGKHRVLSLFVQAVVERLGIN
jgi:hypothetical protein